MSEPQTAEQTERPLTDAEIAEWAATIETHAVRWTNAEGEALRTVREVSIEFSRRILATIASLQSERERTREMVAKLKNAHGYMRCSKEVTEAPTREVWMRANDVLAILQEWENSRNEP